MTTIKKTNKKPLPYSSLFIQDTFTSYFSQDRSTQCAVIVGHPEEIKKCLSFNRTLPFFWSTMMFVWDCLFEVCCATNSKFYKISPGISLNTVLTQVRAKQAARALEAMTRSPAQAKEAVRLTRLPEIARILRNLFVAEKKGVLTREQVLCKLSDSYRESLSHG